MNEWDIYDYGDVFDYLERLREHLTSIMDMMPKPDKTANFYTGAHEVEMYIRGNHRKNRDAAVKQEEEIENLKKRLDLLK